MDAFMEKGATPTFGLYGNYRYSLFLCMYSSTDSGSR